VNKQLYCTKQISTYSILESQFQELVKGKHYDDIVICYMTSLWLFYSVKYLHFTFDFST